MTLLDCRRRRLLGAAVLSAVIVLLHPAVAPTVDAWSVVPETQGVIGTTQPPIRDMMACSQENVDFYLSKRWTRAVIPLSNDCLRQYQREKLQYPGNSTVFLKGLPKMGTTWTEVLTVKLIERACKSGLYDCAYDKFGNNAAAAFASHSTSDTAVLMFRTRDKHAMPAGNKKCGPQCWRPDLATKKFKEPKRSKWGPCVQQRKYMQFHECSAKWAGEPADRWSEIWMQGAKHLRAKFSAGGLRHAGDHNPQPAAPVNLIKKYIMVMRDPRDSIVSFIYYHYEFSPKNSKQLMADVRKIFPHYAAWQGFWYYYQFRHVSKHWPTLRLIYQHMSNDPAREYERVLDFLGLKVRSGKAGGFRDVMDAETVKFCNSIMLDKLPPELNVIFGVQ